MSRETSFERYQELQAYVGWNSTDVELVRAAGPLLERALPGLVADFYQEIERHPAARKVITGGSEQIERLKGTLTNWLRELFSGVYDRAYVDRRWKVGYRHVEIGLDQVYTNVALSRLRTGVIEELQGCGKGIPDLAKTILAINRLLDLDLAIIEDAYHTEYTARSEAAERLATIGQVAGGIAHELRNPLNVIKTSAYYLLNARSPSAEKTREHLRRIEDQVGLADGVITALSNFARLPLPNFQPISVPKILNDFLAASAVRSDVQVQIDVEASLPLALADPEQLRIVFGNLIRNAEDAMPQGGQLTLTARTDGKMVAIHVSDTGHGMEEAVLARIMEPLYTTKARGIGLGLSMARAIVEKINGSLSVKSEPGRGTTFTVCLEAAQDERGRSS